MATSGSIDYSVNARELVTFALQLIRVGSIGEDPSAEDAARAFAAAAGMASRSAATARSTSRIRATIGSAR